MSMTNCVNCGSAKETTATVCPFCGTSYFDLTDIDLEGDHPCVVRFKFHNNIFSMKAFVRMAEFTIRPNVIDCTSLNDTRRMYLHQNNELSANIEFVSAE